MWSILCCRNRCSHFLQWRLQLRIWVEPGKWEGKKKKKNNNNGKHWSGYFRVISENWSGFARDNFSLICKGICKDMEIVYLLVSEAVLMRAVAIGHNMFLSFLQQVFRRRSLSVIAEISCLPEKENDFCYEKKKSFIKQTFWWKTFW